MHLLMQADWVTSGTGTVTLGCLNNKSDISTLKHKTIKQNFKCPYLPHKNKQQKKERKRDLKIKFSWSCPNYSPKDPQDDEEWS